ncbi:MAG: Mov34/MPN/PAD-1 family protein [Acidobacteria bacterium]|nr:Mov34/MPN/PAD-1 family protein [Acidobacteriota bacterium]MCI0717480.1 Mov34/MPN/PAD-1 family protein [Acidobacteriota bacterium]
MEVYLSEDAFWGLLISAIEVYKKECYGYLIGYRDENNVFIVEHALSHQSAQRYNTGVIENKRAIRRMKKFLSNIPPLTLIGDFHSHAGWGDLKAVPTPSNQDVLVMEPKTVYIIIEVNDKRKSVPWNYNDDGALSGTTDDYYFKIVAYYLNLQSKVKRANIFCPYAIGFDAKPRRNGDSRLSVKAMGKAL